MDESSVCLVEKQPVSFLDILCLSEFPRDIDMKTATMGTVQILQELSYWTEMVGKNSNVLFLEDANMQLPVHPLDSCLFCSSFSASSN